MSENSLLGPLAMTFAEVCDVGKVRQENQDNVRHASTPLGELLIVADGMGGYQGGATASRIVVESIIAYLDSTPREYPPDEAIREAVACANRNIATEAHAPGSANPQMGSTVVLALLIQAEGGTQALIAHIGDSRAYLVRADELQRITSDHSKVQELVDRKTITPEEALHHPDASALTRSLGHQPDVEIDIRMVPLQEGDGLLLCSDGLWGAVPYEVIKAVAANQKLTVELVAQVLLDLALAAGGRDNIGIEMVRLSRAPAAVALKQPRRHGALLTMSACLLAIAGLGALAWIALHTDWLHALRP